MTNPISIKISPEIIKELDKIAEKTERSRSQTIRLALRDFVKGEGNAERN